MDDPVETITQKLARIKLKNRNRNLERAQSHSRAAKRSSQQRIQSRSRVQAESRIRRRPVTSEEKEIKMGVENLEKLPLDVLQTIFMNMSVKDISRNCRLSERFDTLCKRESLWKQKVFNYGVTDKLETTWRQTAMILSRRFKQVSAGGDYSVALGYNGTLVSWGNDDDNQVSSTPRGSGFRQVSSGGHSSVALRENGSLVSWGDNYDKQVSGTPRDSDFRQVSGGASHSVALRKDGTLVSWGYDN